LLITSLGSTENEIIDVYIKMSDWEKLRYRVRIHNIILFCLGLSAPPSRTPRRPALRVTDDEYLPGDIGKDAELDVARMLGLVKSGDTVRGTVKH